MPPKTCPHIRGPLTASRGPDEVVLGCHVLQALVADVEQEVAEWAGKALDQLVLQAVDVATRIRGGELGGTGGIKPK